MEKEPNRNDLMKTLSGKNPQEIRSCSFEMEHKVGTIIHSDIYIKEHDQYFQEVWDIITRLDKPLNPWGRRRT